MMEKIGKKNTINMGMYGGMTLGSCIKLYGRKSLLDVLKYYDVDEEVMRECHYHKVEKEEPLDVKSYEEENYDDWVNRLEEWVKEYDTTFDSDVVSDEDYQLYDDPVVYEMSEDEMWFVNDQKYPWEMCENDYRYVNRL